MKNEIIKLRKKGKTYDQIASSLKCSKSTVAWHCSKKVRLTQLTRQKNNRKKFIDDLKVGRGGKCEKCGYDKCLAALHFHHRDPKDKTKIQSTSRASGIVQLASYKGYKYAAKESKLCDLICANCHAETHYPDLD